MTFNQERALNPVVKAVNIVLPGQRILVLSYNPLGALSRDEASSILDSVAQVLEAGQVPAVALPEGCLFGYTDLAETAPDSY